MTITTTPAPISTARGPEYVAPGRMPGTLIVRPLVGREGFYVSHNASGKGRPRPAEYGYPEHPELARDYATEEEAATVVAEFVASIAPLSEEPASEPAPVRAFDVIGGRAWGDEYRFTVRRQSAEEVRAYVVDLWGANAAEAATIVERRDVFTPEPGNPLGTRVEVAGVTWEVVDIRRASEVDNDRREIASAYPIDPETGERLRVVRIGRADREYVSAVIVRDRRGTSGYVRGDLTSAQRRLIGDAFDVLGEGIPDMTPAEVLAGRLEGLRASSRHAAYTAYREADYLRGFDTPEERSTALAAAVEAFRASLAESLHVKETAEEAAPREYVTAGTVELIAEDYAREGSASERDVSAWAEAVADAVNAGEEPDTREAEEEDDDAETCDVCGEAIDPDDLWTERAPDGRITCASCQHNARRSGA